MALQKIDGFRLSSKSTIKVTVMGNVIETMYLSKRNTKATVQRLKDNKMLILSTGEIKEITPMENRLDSKNSLKKTMRALRNLLNANITDVKKCRWITLTYAENMTDTKRLYSDFDKFNKRLKYHCEKNKYGKYEYIVAMEPQGRGAWHAHLVCIFEKSAPFIENKVLSDIWGHGFVTIKKLDDVDNVGAYLTAYLGDMDLEEVQGLNFDNKEIKTVEYVENGEKKKKYYVKGARLSMYPPKFNLYRYSRGVNKPVEEYMPLEEVKKKVSGATLTYGSTHLFTSEDGFECVIDKKYYNKKRVKKQESEEKDNYESKMYEDLKPTFIDEVRYSRRMSEWKPMYDKSTGEIFSTPFDIPEDCECH